MVHPLQTVERSAAREASGGRRGASSGGAEDRGRSAAVKISGSWIVDRENPLKQKRLEWDTRIFGEGDA
jgi:hypothetical protein